MFSTFRIGAIALLACAIAPAVTMAEEVDYSAIEAKLRLLAPRATSIVLSETPLDGLLQVQIEDEFVYVSRDGKYLLTGAMINLDTRENLTEQAMSVLRKELIDGFDLEESIRFAPEAPDFELLVFTDIDCGWCRKLHEQVGGYNEQGIAINYLAFPRAGIDSKSYDKFVSVWCADDQLAALTLAKAGKDPDRAQCENPIESQFYLGREVGISGTPAILTTAGQLVPNGMSPVELRSWLDAQTAN